MKPKETLFLTDRIGDHENLQSDRRTQHAPRLRPPATEENEEYSSQRQSSQDSLEYGAVDDTTASIHLADTVSLNVPVVVRDLRTNEEITFTIVECEAVDPDRNRISFVSPIGFALLWKRPGDSVKVNLPDGQAHYQIVGLTVESTDL